MPLSTTQRSSLLSALRIEAGISDTDPRIRQAALLIRDSGASNATSTVRIADELLTVTGDSTGVDAYGLGSSATLTSLVQTIELALAGAGVTLDIIAPDASQPAVGLLDIPATNLLAGDVTLYVQSTLLLEQLLDQAAARVERYCRTQLFDNGTAKSAVLWAGNGYELALEDGRITQLEFLSVDDQEALRVGYTGAGTASIEVTATQVLLRTRALSNPTVTTTIDLDDSTDVQDVVDDIATVADWTATTVNDGPSLDLVAMPVQRVLTQDVTLDAWAPADGEYRLDRDAGVVYTDELRARYGGSRIAGQVRVRYRAGFATIPADLEGVLVTVAKAGLDAQRRDAGLASESLGDYSWTAAGGSVPAGAMQDAMMAQGATLASYRRFLP